MKQLVFVHGGEAFNTYKDYIDALRTWEYDPSQEHPRRWKDALAESLGEEWQVLMPSMPSKNNAKYLEWCIWFDKVAERLTGEVVLVGHSLGGIFLAKYLSEGSVPVPVRATFLVASVFDDEEEALADFILPPSLARFREQAGQVFLYHSTDDDIVPFAHLAKYQEQLPDATVRTFTDRGHFLIPEFPEIIADIKALG
jgi:predicted alpha/beta hydrolase family esterase